MLIELSIIVCYLDMRVLLILYFFWKAVIFLAIIYFIRRLIFTFTRFLDIGLN